MSLPFPTAIRGPSYSLPMRVGATLLLLPALPFGVRGLIEVVNVGLASPMALVMLGAFVGMIGTYVHILKAETVVDSDGIRQVGLMERKVAWSEVESLRLRRWGATRLVVRTGRGPAKIFVAGTEELREAFERAAGSFRRR